MMWNVVQEVCERENSVEMNEFKSWKLAEIGLEMRELETRKLEILLFRIEQNFQVFSQKQYLKPYINLS